jgi:hypothetical protein
MFQDIKRDTAGKLVSISDVVWRIFCANRDGHGNAPLPVAYRVAMLHILKKTPQHTGIDTGELLKTVIPEYVRDYFQVVRDTVWNRRMFRTKSSRGDILGLCPRYTKEGDYLFILYGCSVPVILRSHEIDDSKVWELIGEVYADGIMEGEVLLRMDQDELKPQEEEPTIRLSISRFDTDQRTISAEVKDK